MRIDQKTGLIDGVHYVPSPNFNQRPADTLIDLLVIHNISLPPDQFGGNYVEQLFTNTLDPSEYPCFIELAELRVSAHILIDRLGKITQFVPFYQRAWHAGESSFEGRSNCNDYSIGIELEGSDQLAYTPIQYDRLIDLTRALLTVYPNIKEQRIVGHCDVAPKRKTDPGQAFDWSYYLSQIKES